MLIIHVYTLLTIHICYYPCIYNVDYPCLYIVDYPHMLLSMYIHCSLSTYVTMGSGQTRDYKIGICCFSAKHAALRRKSRLVGSESE